MSNKSKGIGDTISKITKATGIDKIAKKVLGDDCGCEERRKKLNEIFPYSRQMTEDEIKIYGKLPSYYNGKKHYVNGFDKLSDSELEEEGFFDVETPSIDYSIQELGKLSFSKSKNKFVYAVKNKTWSESASDLKSNKISQIKNFAKDLLSNTDWYITRQAEGVKDAPADIIAARKKIRDDISRNY